MSLKKSKRILRKITFIFIAAWFSLGVPVATLAAEVDPTPSPVVSPAPTDATGQTTTGAPACTGAGCGQGANQGTNQGKNQGGPSLKDLGATKNDDGEYVLPEGVKDTRQGSTHGHSHGANNGISGSNSNTGPDSGNKIDVDSASGTNNKTDNQAYLDSQADLVGNTGGNAANKNTGTSETQTGDAGIGVTQVKNANTTNSGGSTGLNVSGFNGSQNGDFNIEFGNGTSELNSTDGGSSQSIKAVNDTTGSDSNNEIKIKTKVEEENDIKNDGKIDNKLDLTAITGQNESNKNTGDGIIKTGDAKIAATLINLLNTNIINGSLWISVADIFGDLVGNINMESLSALASKLGITKNEVIDAVNEGTGSDSTNTIDINISEKEKTDIKNEAEINTAVNAEAITGQNTVEENTGGGVVKTGDASASASNVSIANTTVEGGNWGLVIVNSFNRWIGFFFGDNGEVTALSQEETIRQIEARNAQTGEGSDNSIEIDIEKDKKTSVDNKAVINNEINATAITGQNESSQNTGQGNIETGDAHIQATTVNMANTTVKDGALFISVVNILGDWWGDLFYDGQALSDLASSGGTSAVLNAGNHNTGPDSENNINVNIDKEKKTSIKNKADINTALNANLDTGSNVSNRNTMGGDITTGNSTIALNSHAAANLTAIADADSLAVEIIGSNDTTGFNSQNAITATINNGRVVKVINDADINTAFVGIANTGGNTASHNTVGGNITTGYADATVSIENLINSILMGMGGGDVSVMADLSNQNTGADSINSNQVDVSNLTLIDIISKGLVNNLIDLLLNTGGNTASHNTYGGNISTGEGCVAGHIGNDINSFNANGIGGASLGLTSDAKVNNDVDIKVETGNNELMENTFAEQDVKNIPCPIEEAAEPGPDPTPLPGIVDKEDPKKVAVGGVTLPEEEEEERVPRVAAAVDREPPLPPFFRFPVAGGEDVARWIQGSTQSPWLAFTLASLLILGVAYYLDRRKQHTSLAW